MDEEFDFEEPQPQQPSNRTFRIALFALGGLLVVSIICLALYLLVYVPWRDRGMVSATETAIAATQIAQAQPSDTPLPLATVTPIPTNTSVPVLQPTATSVLATATATQTATAIIVATMTPIIRTPTPTALPATGFADEIPIPYLGLIALSLFALIFLVRRIRAGLTSEN